jgi:hypothetical protein
MTREKPYNPKIGINRTSPQPYISLYKAGPDNKFLPPPSPRNIPSNLLSIPTSQTSP